MGDKKLTIVGHLAELRLRIIITALSILFGTILSYFYIEEITHLLIIPAGYQDFVYLSPPELFLSYIKISIICGIFLALPIILFQVWFFVMPSVTIRDKVYMILAILMSTIFFVGGVVFSYFIIIPLTLEFFTELSSNEITPMFSFASYLSFILSILLSFGLAFQLPLLVLLLTKLNLITPELLKKSRKYTFLLIFLFASILTPPDVISQVLLAGPMILLFELSIIISNVIKWRSKK
ncbi:twin-arginine translocase subunit TatC [Proteinivorax tanatarense]|uniref:Sec-independent protein translocase protein TatC n=1 Tax=Proteinivorax tanatarense TaxID=1260629 RepID=A0AAU7VPH5_9FIRM